MSQKVFQLAEKMDLNELEMQLALQCAPLLTGIKVSNLLIVNCCNKNSVIDMFDKSMISHYVLHETKEKVIFLLYRKENLQEYLNRQEVNILMTQYGYESQKLLKVLKRFSMKYCYYMNYRGEFPHEMGLILGYPVDDVKGFIDNEGKEFLYTGYWKVYSDLHKTIEVFEKYNKAKELLIQLVKQGMSIRSIIESYKINNLQMAI